MKDQYGREINYLRISLIDRCNLRCVYCMPLKGLKFISKDELLTPSEIEIIARAAATAGFRKFRLTGGEPTLRPDLVEIVERLAQLPGVNTLVLTTNGLRMPTLAKDLAQAGLKRANIHLDSPEADSLTKTMRFGNIDKAWAGIKATEEAGLLPIKLNAVVTRGYNDQAVVALAGLTIENPWHMRFIELMPLGGPAEIAMKNFVPSAETKEKIDREWGELMPVNDGNLDGEARLFQINGAKGIIGFISPISNPYCGACNRMRVTTDGHIRLCLLSDKELDLRSILRNTGNFSELIKIFELGIWQKPVGHEVAKGIYPELRNMSQIGG